MPDKVHCAHILVKTEQEAKSVLDHLNKGEKFSNVAREVSLCPSGKRGGDLGTFTRGKMVREFETVAFALEKGQTSAVVRTKFGCHIIKRSGVEHQICGIGYYQPCAHTHSSTTARATNQLACTGGSRSRIYYLYSWDLLN